MKNQTGIWIDGSKAVIVSLEDGNEKISEVEASIENRIYHRKEGDKGSFMGSRHLNNQRKFDERIEHQTEGYLKNVVDKIKDADELYLFGPANMKLKLKCKIEENKLLANKLKSVETSDSLTNNQIVEKVKTFYLLEPERIKGRL